MTRGAKNSVIGWITDRLSLHLAVPAHTIDPHTPLADMGVDSVRALGLVGDVEAHWDIDVDPTLVFDYPTVSDMAEFICSAVHPMRSRLAANES